MRRIPLVLFLSVLFNVLPWMPAALGVIALERLLGWALWDKL